MHFLLAQRHESADKLQLHSAPTTDRCDACAQTVPELIPYYSTTRVLFEYRYLTGRICCVPPDSSEVLVHGHLGQLPSHAHVGIWESHSRCAPDTVASLQR